MIRPFGEAALLVELDSPEQAQALADSLRRDPLPSVVATVPGLDSLLVELDPLRAEPDMVMSAIPDRLAALVPAAPSRTLHTIRVIYDGPDLDDVAALTGLSPPQLVELHASTELRVLFCGFAPGFAYLGDLPPRLRVDRLATPRTRTPAGSVAIAGTMTGVYPAELPGGWRIIGRTSATLFDPRRDPPTLLVPGDRVRFEPVT